MPILNKIRKLLRESGSMGFFLLNLKSYVLTGIEDRFVKPKTNGNKGTSNNHTKLLYGYALLPDGNRLTYNWRDRHEVNFIVNEIYRLKVYDRMGGPQEGFTVIDVGGHIGVYTLHAAKKVGSQGRVVAVEPSPENYHVLVENVAANRLKNVTIVNTALADVEGSAKLYLKDSGKHSLVRVVPGEYIETRLTTLDGLIEELGLDSIDILKIDVEGAEMEVLKGGENALKSRIKGVVIAAYHYATEADEIQQYLQTVAPHLKVKVVPSKEDSPKDLFLYAYIETHQVTASCEASVGKAE